MISHLTIGRGKKRVTVQLDQRYRQDAAKFIINYLGLQRG